MVFLKFSTSFAEEHYSSTVATHIEDKRAIMTGKEENSSNSRSFIKNCYYGTPRKFLPTELASTGNREKYDQNYHTCGIGGYQHLDCGGGQGSRRGHHGHGHGHGRDLDAHVGDHDRAHDHEVCPFPDSLNENASACSSFLASPSSFLPNARASPSMIG